MMTMRGYHFFIILIAVTILSFWFSIDKECTVTRRAAISKGTKMKFILVWTNRNKHPDNMHLDNGVGTFASRNCAYTNCYVTSNRTFFEDIRVFDVLVFYATEFWNTLADFPSVRAPHQKYVFAIIESSCNYQIRRKKINNFFNWTWTYKINSDVIHSYIVVRNKTGEIVGPRSVMHWERVENMEPIDNKLIAKLKTKVLAAAWFVSNCHALNYRLEFGYQLKVELARLNLTLDIYGSCGVKRCPRQFMKDCLQIVERDYYFYLSFENSFGEDYVTEKVLHALQHYAVPVVYGGANYTRFMPDGTYLDARKLSIKELALRMSEIIKDKEKYYDFFRWHNHYSYHHVDEAPDSDGYCKLCALINNKDLFNAKSVYENFVSWWNAPGICERGVRPNLT